MASKRKPYNDRAGYVCSLRSGVNRGWVVVYEAGAQGFDVGGDRYAVVCETHGTVCGSRSMSNARTLMKSVEFCDCCMLRYD